MQYTKHICKEKNYKYPVVYRQVK